MVAAVLDDGRSLDQALDVQRDEVAQQDGALVSVMAYGVLRDYRYLRALLEPLLKRAPQPMLEALLLVGVYQLRAMRVPAHAAVHATVAATAPLRLGRARAMVNAVLRRCQREMTRLEQAVPAVPATCYSFPDWLVERLSADWPGRAEAVLAASNQPASMHLRVNRRAATRTVCRRALAAAGVEAAATLADGLTLAAPVASAALPGFADGWLSIQDAGAQRAADLLAPADGQRVLDACAAPGNKTAHILERADVDLLALDVDRARVDTLRANLARLHLQADVRMADALRPGDWWDGKPFDRILLDAPCSGTGVIRRHPDIKWLRRPADIEAATRRQRMLLAALWPLLAEGGLLVYAVCSLLRAEGADVVKEFLAATPEAQEQSITAEWGEAEAVGRRIAPGEDGCDGFYYACIQRQPE